MKKKPETKEDRVTRHVMYVLEMVLWGICAFMLSPIVFCVYILVVAGLIFLSRHRKRQRKHTPIAASPASSEQTNADKPKDKPKSEEQIRQEERRRDREKGQQLYEAWKEEYPQQVQKLIEWKNGIPFIPDVLSAYFSEYDLRNIMPYHCNWVAQLEGHSLLDTVRDYISWLTICDTIRAIEDNDFMMRMALKREHPKIDFISRPSNPKESTYLLAMDAAVTSTEDQEEILSLLKKYQISVLAVQNEDLSRWPITTYKTMTDWVTGEICEWRLEDAGWDNDTTYDNLVLHTISKPKAETVEEVSPYRKQG